MNKLLAISIASASIAIGAVSALAEVDPKIHKLCIDAKDYAGCVKSQSGGAITNTSFSSSENLEQKDSKINFMNLTNGDILKGAHILLSG